MNNDYLSDNLKNLSAGGSLGGLFGSLFATPFAYGHYAEDLGKIPEELKPYYQQQLEYMTPYMEGGLQAGSQLGQQLQEISSPDNYVSKVLGEWQETPAARYQREQGLKSISGNLATQGLTGSGPEAKALQNYGQQLTGMGQQQYLQNIQGVRNQLLNQLQNIYGKGLGASAQAGDYTSQLMNDLQQIRMAQAQAEAQSETGFGGLLGGLTGIVSSFL